MNKIKNKMFYTKLYKQLSSESDVIIKEEKELRIVLFYQEQLCNIALFNKDYLPSIRDNKDLDLDQAIIGVCKKFEKEDSQFLIGLLQVIFSGLLIVYDLKKNEFYLFDISQSPSRTTSDSSSEPEVVFGSRDGFVENYKVNIALLRTRIKESHLAIDEFCVGVRSKTYVGLLSIEDIHNQGTREEIKRRLSSINIDAALSIYDIASVFQENKMFPCYQYVGSSDLAARHLLDGQFLIVIDRIPSLLMVPINFSSFTRLRIDNINIKIFPFFERLFVLGSLFVSTIFLGLLASFVTYQSNCLSLLVLATLKISQKGIIFPTFIEIIFVLLLFELYYMVGFRSPKMTISSMIVLVGGLIIGQNTISSGMVGVLIMTFTALSFLSTFTITSNVNFVNCISVIRFLIVLSSLFFGLVGVILCSLYLLSLMYKEKTLGVSFFSPFIPLDFKEMYYYFLPQSRKNKVSRPSDMRPLDDSMKESI